MRCRSSSSAVSFLIGSRCASGGGGAAYWFLKMKKDIAPKTRMMDESGFEDEDEDESENNNEQGE